MSGIAFELGELGLERLGLTRLQHVGVVVDAAAQGWHVECDGNRTQHQKEDD